MIPDFEKEAENACTLLFDSDSWGEIRGVNEGEAAEEFALKMFLAGMRHADEIAGPHQGDCDCCAAISAEVKRIERRHAKEDP